MLICAAVLYITKTILLMLASLPAALDVDARARSHPLDIKVALPGCDLLYVRFARAELASNLLGVATFRSSHVVL